jgi:transcriptional antiterminator NusG
MELTEQHLAPREGHAEGQRLHRGRHPAPVPEPEINAIEQQVAEGTARPKPRVVLRRQRSRAGHRRRVRQLHGHGSGGQPAKQKVTVLVSIFGRATPVELEYAQVEKTP